MPRIKLNSDPYEFELFCPFCGKHVLSGGDEGFAEGCEHTICLGPDDSEGQGDIVESDVVFEVFEAGPAGRTHVFAFREPA